MNQEERLAIVRNCLTRAKRGTAARRLAAEHRDGYTGELPKLPPATRSAPPRARTEREQLLDAGLYFTAAEHDRQAADTAHRERRRRAEQDTTQRDRLHAKLRDLEGLDYADEYLR